MYGEPAASGQGREQTKSGLRRREETLRTPMCGTLRAVDRVAYNLKHADPAMVSSSNNPDGEFWKAAVPNEVRAFV